MEQTIDVITLLLLLPTLIIWLFSSLKTKRKMQETYNDYKGKYISLTDCMQTEDKIRQDELICTINQLKALIALRDKLFTNVSHDIRNPIANMVSMMEVLDEDYYSNDSREIVHEVRKQVENTFLMVDTLPEWINIQRSKLADVYISKAAQETVNELLNIVGASGTRIINNLEDTVTLFTCIDILGMALHNLFNNASKYFRAGGLVAIQTQQIGQNVIITIRDTGISIGFNEVKILFKDAYATAATDTAGETGGGILICKESLQRNGGKIWLDTIVEKSNTFYFYLPSE